MNRLLAFFFYVLLASLVYFYARAIKSSIACRVTFLSGYPTMEPSVGYNIRVFSNNQNIKYMQFTRGAYRRAIDPFKR